MEQPLPGNSRPLRFAYNTNGFVHHRLEDAIEILATLGYDGIALTLDFQHLDPFTASPAELEKLRAFLLEKGLAVTVETGAKFLLDPWHKQEPTLVSLVGRARRLEYLCRAVDVASALGAESVGFFSGHLSDGVEPDQAMEWLTQSCEVLCRRAANAGVPLAIEPEPGMFIGNLESAAQLIRRVGSPALGATVDLGHVRCSERLHEADAIEAYAHVMRAVHIEDIAGRSHAHLLFGEGDMLFEPILAALLRVGYTGLVSAELSRDSERAPDAAKQGLEFLRKTAARVSTERHAPRLGKEANAELI
jgi:sugar phosphate isomerase/epimerase